MTEVVKYAVDADGIATLTIDYQGKTMNVIDQALMDSLAAGIEKVVADPAVKGAIVTSGKDTFVAGADLKQMEANLDSTAEDSIEVAFEKFGSLSKILRRLETCGKPFAAAINGVAMGGGLEIALACHYRVAVDNPRVMFGLPEVMVGLLPGAGGTQRMIRMLGIQGATPYLMEGKNFNPTQGKELGIIHEVVPAAQLLATAKAWLLSDKASAVAPWDDKKFKFPGGNALMPQNAQAFVVGNAMIQSKTMRNMPSPMAIQSLMFEGSLLPMDKALRVETKYMTQVARSAPSRAMIRTLFVNKEKADKLEFRPQGIAKFDSKKMGMIGGGMMGAAIALTAAKVGIQVVLIDISQELAEKGKQYAVTNLQKQVERGRLTAEKMQKTLDLIIATTDYELLRDTDIIIEAVPENTKIKAEVTAKLEQYIPETCVFASNTSGIPISKLAKASSRPERFIGLHFFSPADRMPLIEVIRGEKTTDATLAQALDFVAKIKKTPIIVNDVSDFYTTRLIGSFIDESMRMLNEGVSPALLENAAKQAGMPVGPLTIMDELSIDLAVGAAANKAREYDDFVPSITVATLQKLFDLKRMGKKVGKGFYDWTPEGKSLWTGLQELFPAKPAAEQPPVQDVKNRILYAQALNAAGSMERGTLTSPADGDIGSILGVGFPAYLGGPFCMMDEIGLANFVQEADRLASLYGEHLRPNALLRDMAAKGETFYGKNARKIAA